MLPEEGARSVVAACQWVEEKAFSLFLGKTKQNPPQADVTSNQNSCEEGL